MVDDGKPSLDEALAHFGVLGMKWGKTRAKASTVQIHAARQRVGVQKAKLKRTEASAARISDDKKRQVAEKSAAKMRTAYLKNPDRVTAARMTRGEKAAITLLTAATFGVASPVVFAPLAVTSAHSRRIERKQETGKYDKK